MSEENIVLNFSGELHDIYSLQYQHETQRGHSFSVHHFGERRNGTERARVIKSIEVLKDYHKIK